MADPLRFFPEAKQKEMAGQVWQLAASKTQFFSTICSINQYRFLTPDAKRVLHAKDWLTFHRQDGSPEDNDHVNAELGKPIDYYSGECIAEVEHFFVAAFMEVAIGPALTQVGVLGWETFDITLKHPILKAMDAHNNGRSITEAFLDGFPKGLRGWLKSVEWNGGQAIRAQSGIVFGSELIEGKLFLIDPSNQAALTAATAAQKLRDAVNFLERVMASDPPPRLPNLGSAPIGTCPIPPAPGIPDKEFVLDFKDPNKRSLSAVAKIVYGSFDYWPLLWWHNPTIQNPNRLQGMRSIRYREKHTYAPSDFQKAKDAAPSWKNFPL
jgi:hypothetical protein